MLKIALAGQKGGVGKSTLAWLLINAALANSDETTILLIETDRQGSSAMYHQRVMRNILTLPPVFTVSHALMNKRCW